MEIINITSMKKRLKDFAEIRDWNQFHSPKNLSMALTVEAGELLELFQWVSEQDSLDPKKLPIERVGEELADILVYLIRISDKLEVNLVDAVERKLKINAEKYPPEKCFGLSKKYNELEDSE